jgi:hypothetical protein
MGLSSAGRLNRGRFLHIGVELPYSGTVYDWIARISKRDRAIPVRLSKAVATIVALMPKVSFLVFATSLMCFLLGAFCRLLQPSSFGDSGRLLARDYTGRNSRTPFVSALVSSCRSYFSRFYRGDGRARVTRYFFRDEALDQKQREDGTRESNN